MTRSLWKIAIAAAVGLPVLFASGNFSPTGTSSFVSQADARLGRPLTPMSAAGVARRHNRRAYYGAAAVGAAAVGAAAARRHSCYINQHGHHVCY
jgi:hypothetical protein